MLRDLARIPSIEEIQDSVADLEKSVSQILGESLNQRTKLLALSEEIEKTQWPLIHLHLNTYGFLWAIENAVIWFQSIHSVKIASDIEFKQYQLVPDQEAQMIFAIQSLKILLRDTSPEVFHLQASVDPSSHDITLSVTVNYASAVPQLSKVTDQLQRRISGVNGNLSVRTNEDLSIQLVLSFFHS